MADAHRNDQSITAHDTERTRLQNLDLPGMTIESLDMLYRVASSQVDVLQGVQNQPRCDDRLSGYFDRQIECLDHQRQEIVEEIRSRQITDEPELNLKLAILVDWAASCGETATYILREVTGTIGKHG